MKELHNLLLDRTPSHSVVEAGDEKECKRKKRRKLEKGIVLMTVSTNQVEYEPVPRPNAATFIECYLTSCDAERDMIRVKQKSVKECLVVVYKREV